MIWAGWLVAARASLSPSANGTADASSLSAFEIAFLRTTVPAVLLAWVWIPALVAAAGAARKPPIALWALMCLWGMPFVYCAGRGLAVDHVAVAGALVPGGMPLIAAALAWTLFAARPSPRARTGLTLIALAGAFVAAPTLLSGATAPGAPWFLAAAACWAGFAVAYPRSGLTGAQAAGLVGAVSTAGAFVIDSAARALGAQPLLRFDAPVATLLTETVAHGVLAGVVSVLAFAAAMARLGPGVAAVSALVPGLAAIMAWVILGERPDGWEAAALVAATIGVALIQTPPRKNDG